MHSQSKTSAIPEKELVYNQRFSLAKNTNFQNANMPIKEYTDYAMYKTLN